MLCSFGAKYSQYYFARQHVYTPFIALVFLANIVFQFVRARGKVWVGQHVYMYHRQVHGSKY
jgi:hypothetical protein